MSKKTSPPNDDDSLDPGFPPGHPLHQPSEEDFVDETGDTGEVKTQAPGTIPGLPNPAKLTAANLEGNQGMALFGSFMERLVDKLSAMQMSPAALKDILLETGQVNAELARKAKWPENADHPHISVYFTEHDKKKYGDWTQKPKLIRDTFFCGVRENEEALTCSEVEAYNAFEKPMECRGGAWRAEVVRPSAVGGKESLKVWVPKETVDQRMVLPSLLLILHELNGGPSTLDVMHLIQQIEHLKSLLIAKGASTAELEAALAAQPY